MPAGRTATTAVVRSPSRPAALPPSRPSRRTTTTPRPLRTWPTASKRYLGNSLRICIHPNDSSDGVIKLQMIEVLRAHWKEGFAEGKGGGLNGCRNCLKVQSCFSLVRFGVQRRFADKQLSTVLSGPQWRTNFVQHPAQAFHTSRLGEQRCCLENPASHDV